MQTQIFEILSGGTCDLQFNPLKTETSFSDESMFNQAIQHLN
jgi:hypothetical protein